MNSDELGPANLPHTVLHLVIGCFLMYRIFPLYIVNRHNNGLRHVHSHQFRHDILFRNSSPYKHVHTLLYQDNVFAK